MSPSPITALSSRTSGILMCGLVLGFLIGCHHGSSAPAKPPTPEKVQVGYGEQSKEKAGGAVQSVTDEEMRNLKVTRVEELLMGRFPGVRVIRTPSGGFSIRIRGGSSILGDKEPLYVVDGIVVETMPGCGLDWLDPVHIKRIDVLKNPAETSMYGVRGANGVIVITTKRSR